MKAGRNIFLILFWLFAIIDIIAVISAKDGLHLAFKPTLMPALLLAILFTKSNGLKKAYIIAALFFSALGDIYLMFDKRDPLFFILGLVSFLIAHLFYIVFFLTLKGTRRSLLREKFWILIIVLAYVSGLLILILPSVGKLMIPVTVYAVILSAMLLSSFHAFHRAPSRPGQMFIGGAIAFVISDSLLAIDKFYTNLGAASFLIMLTYCIAQFLIVSGFIKMSSQTIKK